MLEILPIVTGTHMFNFSEIFALLDKQKAWKNLDLIKSLHLERMKIQDGMEKCKCRETLKFAAHCWTNIQFDLQDAWHFPRDSNYHRYWTLPKCSCPYLDNEDTLGTKYKHIDGKCYHAEMEVV